MKRNLIVAALAFSALAADAHAQQDASTLDRTVLPIAEPKYPAITELDASRVKAPPVPRRSAV